MSNQQIFSAFISYTADDLAAHADVVISVLRKLRVLPIEHRDSGSTGEPSVSWCMSQIAKSDILIVLVAHRYGWIPLKEEGGNGIKSITWMEVDHAWKLGKIVLPYILDEKAFWQVDLVEGLKKPEILESLNSFKNELTKNVSAFFSDAASLDGPVSRDVPNALEKLSVRQHLHSTSPKSSSDPVEMILPWFYNKFDPPSVMDRMKSEIPKRILCMEGGSHDCFVNLGYLEKIELLLQKRYGDPDFRIANYYDLIVGNGFASILALELSLGKSVKEIEPIFKEIVKSYFLKKTSFIKRIYHKYDPEPLRNNLKKFYNSYTLASKEIKTGLAIVVTRFDQAMPWHFINHESWEYFDSMKSVGLDEILEGSMAMPSYMPYGILHTPNLGDIVIGDGGFATGNDNSLYALMLVSSYQFPYKWRFGENMLSLTTIGSKGRRVSALPEAFKNLNLLQQMPLLIDTLLSGAAANSESLLKALAGNEKTGISKTPVLTNHRFDILLSQDALTQLGLNVNQKTFDELFRSTSINSLDLFIKIGRLAADKQITPEHFSPSFDVRDIST